MQYQLEENVIPDDEYNRDTQIKLWTEYWVENLNEYDLHFLERAFVHGQITRDRFKAAGIKQADDYTNEKMIIATRIEIHSDTQHFLFGIVGAVDYREAQKAAEYALTLLKDKDWTS